MSRLKPGDWWDKSWSVVTGCNWLEGEQPAACDNCWTRGMAKRFSAVYGDFSRVVCRRDRMEIPLKRKKPTIYATSLTGDLFHDDVPEEFIKAVLIIASRAVRENGHKFVLLTKRYERAYDLLERWRSEGLSYSEGSAAGHLSRSIILMASVWDQKSADSAHYYFTDLPVKWGMHIEPQLSGIELSKWRERKRIKPDGIPGSGPSWIVVGGETGTNARPMHPDWVRNIRDWCIANRVMFWFKGWGAWGPRYENPPVEQTSVFHPPEVFDPDDPPYYPGIRMYKVGKKRSGRSIDENEWNETPW